MKTITLTNKELTALMEMFDEGPPLSGALAQVCAKLERTKEKVTPFSKGLYALVDALEDNELMYAGTVQAAAEGRLLDRLRAHADLDGACG